jgi:hypothetical protein
MFHPSEPGHNIPSKSLWRWYIGTNIMFLDIIHRLYLKTVLFIFQNNVSETGFCLHLQVKLTKLGPIDIASCGLKIKQDGF